ncbi:hypothetical protein BDW22DRAFT_1061834 [Trametopsis cervina]|nr:hypothetical protein BDW22DRAFT_1061834 [Trametopsis cervina]
MMSAEEQRNNPLSRSSSHQQQHAQSSIIRPPMGFIWDSAGPFTSAVRPPSHNFQNTVPEDPPSDAGRKKRSKDKGKEKEKSKSKDKHKSKHISQADLQASASVNARSPTAAFRVYGYSHEPSPAGSSHVPLHSHYSPNHEGPNHPRDSSQPRNIFRPQDYDRSEQSVPLQHTNSQGQRAPDYPPTEQRPHRTTPHPPNPIQTTGSEHVRRSLPPQPELHHQSAPLQTHQQAHSPASSVSREQRSPEYSPGDIHGKKHKLRLVTLLIYDLRLGESQLAEVRVPFRDRGDGRLWADAQDITDALQSGPSRIDGPAKVSTLRGEFKQIFFRVSAGGDVECRPANIQVSDERTIVVSVEDPNPLGPPVYPYRMANEVLARTAGASTSSSSTVPPPDSAPLPSTDRSSSNNNQVEHESRHRSRSRKRRRMHSGDQHHRPEYMSGGYPEHSQPRNSYYSPAHPVEQIPRPSSVVSTYQTTPQQAEPPLTESSHSGRGPSSSSSSSGSSADSSSESEAISKRKAPSATLISPLSQTGQLSQIPLPAPRQPPSQAASPHPYGHASQGSFSSYPSAGGAVPPPRAPSFSEQQEQHPPTGKRARRSPRNASNTHVPSPSMASVGPQSSNAVVNNPRNDPRNGAFANYASPHRPSASAPSGTSSADTGSSRMPGPSQTQSTIVPAPPQPQLETAVAVHLRSLFANDPAWSEYVEARNNVLSVSQQMKHLQYVQSKLDLFVGKPVPEGISGSSGKTITKAQVAKAFYQSDATWADECTEALRLSRLYGPGGQRGADSQAVALFTEPAPISTKIQMGRYLDLLKKIDFAWTSEHPEEASPR